MDDWKQDAGHGNGRGGLDWLLRSGCGRWLRAAVLTLPGTEQSLGPATKRWLE